MGNGVCDMTVVLTFEMAVAAKVTETTSGNAVI